MSLVITKGYLIKVDEYNVFDNIITFINEHGHKFVAIALGTRKINSKNANALRLGNYNEFEFFHARFENKTSKLKRIVTINELKWPIYNKSFFLLNELVNKLNYPNKLNYEFYNEMLPYTIQEINHDKQNILMLLMKFCKISGINIWVKNCVICNNSQVQTISFKNHGLICNMCFDKKQNTEYNLSLSKLITYLFNEEYNQLETFNNEFDFAIKLLKKYINSNLGIKIETLDDY